MAFQAPVANIATVTGELWPSVKSTFSAPWRVIGEKPHRKTHLGGQKRSMSIASTKTTPKQVDLPDCLAAAPIHTFMAPSLSPQALLKNVSCNETMFAANVLRAANPLFRRYPPSARSYNTSTLSKIFSKPALQHNSIVSATQRRSLFGMGTPSQTLLINMEQTANNNPSSASAQNAFYSALLRASMPQIVVERFQAGRYASNKACEDTYQKALDQVARTEGAGQALQGGTGRQFSEQQLRDISSSSAARAEGHLAAGRYAKATGGTGEKASPVHVLVDEPVRTTIFKWAKFVVGYGLLAYFVLVILTVLVETSGILKGRSPVTNAETQQQQQTAKFSDVHGCDEAKEELQELVEFLKNPDKFSALGGKLPKGVLLVGPPGTGKTLLARAVAGEAGVPFFYMSGSEFDEMYVGVGARRVRDLFNNARAKAPAIVFIDELDAIGAKRNERDPTYVKQSLNQLLTELDGFTQETGVIILGATNFPKLLDKALTRPGRFDRNVQVDLPDVRGRMKILQHYMKKVKVDSDIDAQMIARATPGFSGAQLESLVNQAAVHASTNQTSTVTMMDMEWAKDKIMMGAERRSMVIQDKDKLMTAYHEAGHALVALNTQGSYPIYKATIMPRGQTLGVVRMLPEMDTVSQSRRELVAQLDTAMGGKAAEEVVYGRDMVTTGCSSDLNNATSVAYTMVTQCGMSENLGNIDLAAIYRDLSTETRHSIEAEVRSLLDGAHSRAINIIRSKRKELDLLANALVEYEVLNLDEIKRVLKGEKLQKLKTLKGAPLKLPELVLPPSIGKPSGGGSGGSITGGGVEAPGLDSGGTDAPEALGNGGKGSRPVPGAGDDGTISGEGVNTPGPTAPPPE